MLDVIQSSTKNAYIAVQKMIPGTLSCPGDPVSHTIL